MAAAEVVAVTAVAMSTVAMVTATPKYMSAVITAATDYYYDTLLARWFWKGVS